jgi:hypothetical protein
MKTLTILTIVFNFFIFVGAGHGIGFLGLIEIMAINEIFLGNITFNLTGNYDDRLPVVAILSIIGQSLLLIGFFINDTAKAKLTITGCLTLLIATYILTKDSKDMNLDMISLIFSVPFIVTASTLLIKEILTIKKLKTT